VHDAADEAFFILAGRYRIHCGEQEWAQRNGLPNARPIGRPEARTSVRGASPEIFECRERGLAGFDDAEAPAARCLDQLPVGARHDCGVPGDGCRQVQCIIATKAVALGDIACSPYQRGIDDNDAQLSPEQLKLSSSITSFIRIDVSK